MSALNLVLFAASAGGEASSGALTAVDVALLASTIGSIVLFGGAAVLALSWAFKNGQFENFDQGSKSIFGADEPIGEPTDAFPGAPAEIPKDSPPC